MTIKKVSDLDNEFTQFQQEYSQHRAEVNKRWNQVSIEVRTVKKELGDVRSDLSEIMKVLSTLKLSNEQSSPKGGSSGDYITLKEGPKQSTLQFDDLGFLIPPSKEQPEGSNCGATCAFETLKEAMTQVSVLALPDFNKPFIVETYTSRSGLEAVLMQEGKPIAYFSQVLAVGIERRSKVADQINRDLERDAELEPLREKVLDKDGRALGILWRGTPAVQEHRLKYLTLASSGLLQPLELPEKVWDEVTMDFINGLPKSEGFTVILVVVDRISKYDHFVPLRHPYTSSTMAAIFMREVIRLDGVPKAMVTDRDKQWSRWLSWAEYWYNTSYRTCSKVTPFKILYGRDPPKVIPYETNSVPTFEVDKYLEERDRVLNDLKKNLLKAQQIMKAQSDSHRRDMQFLVGDMVFLKLRPYRQRSLSKRLNEKLAPCYFGPFEVLEKIETVAYRLKLPNTASIHPVFHVSQLKKVVGDQVVETDFPKELTEDMEMRVQPQEVLGVR
uniref:Putative mitochondrial protein n=1 Tax=Tanacetum cinerariifolium TaxID=118510 RepID=A0A6L2KKM8_TANCI|nr:putative mitochondrial protein [Tanacetum cinerariifolium]